MTAGFHFGELKQYQILKRLERADRDIIDMCLTSCFIFVMNKSSPQVTIGAPAPGEELAAVQMRCTPMLSQALGATGKGNAGTQREDLNEVVMETRFSQAHTTGCGLSPYICLSKCPRCTKVPNDHSSSASPCIHSQTLLSFSFS